MKKERARRPNRLETEPQSIWTRKATETRWETKEGSEKPSKSNTTITNKRGSEQRNSHTNPHTQREEEIKSHTTDFS